MRCSRLSFYAVLLLVTFVSSLPIYGDDQRLVARLQVETSDDPKDWPSEEQLRTMMRTEKHQATFWTGRRGDASAEEAAEADALKRGGQTLEMTLHKGGAKMPPWTAGDKKWDQVSTFFADGASGDIHAHIGDPGTVRPNGIYEKTEKVALQANPKVTSITEHHYDGSMSVVKQPKPSKTGR